MTYKNMYGNSFSTEKKMKASEWSGCIDCTEECVNEQFTYCKLCESDAEPLGIPYECHAEQRVDLDMVLCPMCQMPLLRDGKCYHCSNICACGKPAVAITDTYVCMDCFMLKCQTLRDYCVNKILVDRYRFTDNGSKILLIAHADYIGENQFSQDGSMVYFPGLDDRLGCWAIERYLPPIFDTLITTDEEICASSIKETTLKEYNWIVEFDRAGTDAVTYSKYKHDLSEFFTVGQGSYSDIAELPQMGVSTFAFNLGIGYEMQHTPYCCVDLKVFEKQMVKFMGFYEKYKGVKLK